MTAAELRRWVAAAPEGASVTIPCTTLAGILAADAGPEEAVSPPSTEPVASWRHRVWTVAADTRLDAEEAAEALGWTVSTVYRQTHPNLGRTEKTPRPRDERTLPFSRVGRRLVFTAGELRAWIQANTRLEVPGPTDARPGVLPIASRRSAR